MLCKSRVRAAVAERIRDLIRVIPRLSRAGAVHRIGVGAIENQILITRFVIFIALINALGFDNIPVGFVIRR